MSIRSLGRDGPESDEIVCYFMRTILNREKSGILNLPLDNPLTDEPARSFLDQCMGIFCQACSPELAALLLDTEYDAVLSRGPLTAQQILSLRVIKELTWHTYYDEDPYTYLDTTEDLWGQKAMQYSWRTYYPNLPPEAIKKLHREQELAALPEEMRQPDNY